ncbi:MAG: radical SAM protein [Promethearchaeota archaeon]
MGCLRSASPEEVDALVTRAHPKPRGTPGHVAGGIVKNCRLCANGCRIPPGGRGACGARWNDGRRVTPVAGPSRALLTWYLDSNPTNCCLAYCCPATTGSDDPQFSITNRGPERGTFNLAVFLWGCNFDCLFCQNPGHREAWRVDPSGCGGTGIPSPSVGVPDLLAVLRSHPEVTCVCFFGGSPEPHLSFTIRLARAAREAFPGRVLRFCWEWNGAGHPALVDRCAELARETGGIVKFDLKAFHPNVHRALCGVGNERTLENFARVAKTYPRAAQRHPVVGATTPLVSHHVDEAEVEALAEFVAACDPYAPYSLLVFHPDDRTRDLPVTPLEQARAAVKAARKHLPHARLGNAALLGFSELSS